MLYLHYTNDSSHWMLMYLTPLSKNFSTAEFSFGINLEDVWIIIKK